MDPDEWLKICQDAKGVRLLEGGKKLIQQEYDFYDAELKKFVTPEWQKNIEGHSPIFSVKPKHTTGDMYLLWAVEDDDRHGTVVVRDADHVGKMKDFEINLNQYPDNKQEISISKNPSPPGEGRRKIRRNMAKQKNIEEYEHTESAHRRPVQELVSRLRQLCDPGTCRAGHRDGLKPVTAAHPSYDEGDGRRPFPNKAANIIGQSMAYHPQWRCLYCRRPGESRADLLVKPGVTGAISAPA